MNKLKLAPPPIYEIKEPSRAEFLVQTSNEALRFKRMFPEYSTGSLSVDRAINLPGTPQPERQAFFDPPDECPVCDELMDEVVDGVVASTNSWTYMCCSCHKKLGIGFGDGRGHLYLRKDGEFVKVS